MITYHCDTNLILAVPFKTGKVTHRLKEYNKIIQHLHNHRLRLNLQILYNEASADYKQMIKEKWKIHYQLVPCKTYQRNIAEQSI